MFRFFSIAAVLAFSVVAWAEPANCIAVDGPYVLAKHLASIYPEFLGLGDTTLSYAPPPGSRRTVSATEISGWAQSHALSVPVRRGACFERTGVTLTAEDYRRAIREQLKEGKSAAEIDVLDFYSRVMPPGHLLLPISGAGLPPRDHPETPFLWRGQLISSEGASYPVWARLRILINQNVVRAMRNLPAGTILDPQQLRSGSEPCNPFGPGDAEPVSFYLGKSLTRSVTAGSRVSPELVQDPPDVQRGDKVRVAVVSGSARLELDALAEATGYVGDSILFSNPAGSKRFRALITGSGRAEILLNSSTGDARRRTAVQKFANTGSS